jgi:chorismate mutase
MSENADSIWSLRPLDSWSPGGSRLDIFGPCSAESERQLAQAAEGLVALERPFVFRAGIWKPRTRPGSFEGLGVTALPWLKSIKERFNIPVITEVAKAEHVEACLEHDIDMLWIGARTTVNPFSVQEIADALNGVDIPILVKNPIHPDLSLWIGALERVMGAGIKSVAAIHRGFHYHDNRPYRNMPNWELPIELKRLHPKLPIICDISHIAGSPDLLHQVAQRALDLMMDGLHIEVHPDPQEALSDARQQINPDALEYLFKGLRVSRRAVNDPIFIAELEKLRSQIDEIDTRIVELLVERMKVVEEIGEQKRDKGVSIFQLKRWKAIIEHYMSQGSEEGLSGSFLREVVEAIHSESIDIQQRIMDGRMMDQSKS